MRERFPVMGSLRWRLPIVSGGLIVLVLLMFLAAAYRQVEQTLVEAGANRAEGAAQQIGERLSRSMAGVMATTSRTRYEPALLAMLRNPTERSRGAARGALVPANSPPALRRQEVWDNAGSLVLEIASPRADTARLQSFPPGAPPAAAGISELKRSGNYAFFEILTEIRADSSPGAERLGYHRRFGQLTSSGMPLGQLIGRGASIKIGAPGTPVWTNFFTAVDPVQEQDPRGSGHEYRAVDGSLWIGGYAPIEQSPWQVWVGYPREVIVAPAQAFLQRMLVIALFFVAFSVALASLLGARLTRPLHALAAAAGRIAVGDYAKRVSTNRRDEIGLLSHAFNTMSDRIDEVHRALRKNNDQTHFLLATARIGIWESHIDTEEMRCSESMGLVHGVTTGSLPRTRQAFLELVHAEDRDALQRVLEGHATDGDVIDLRYRAIAPDGSVHWIEGKARVKKDDDGRPLSILGVSADVTDRLRLEMQLSQAQKMEAFGQLAGGVAHDFNNLLTAIVGHAQMVLDEIHEPGVMRDDVGEILKAAESGAGLTRQLLAFSRQQVTQPEVVAINTIVARTDKLLRRLIGENIHFVVQLAPDLAAVRVDPGQLEQVFVNLAVNARDAMLDGGTLTITTANTYLTEAYVREHASVPAGPYVMLSVHDTGTGMDPETQRRLFEPFFTTKPAGKGTGLGLATVFGIVKQSGGHIHVKTELNGGSTFTIYLPSTSEVPATRPPRVPAPRTEGRSETLLVVEDNAPVRTIAKTILERAGYNVLVAASGEEALRMVEASKVRFDLVVSDVIMPGITGPALARQLVARYPDIRVLFTSGYSGAEVVRHGIEDSGTMFIEKPYTPTTLANKVAEALSGSRSAARPSATSSR